MRAIRGRVAAIKWAYYTAAAVEGYAVTQTGTEWRATGALVPGTGDAFTLTRRPLFLVCPHKGGAWRWEILTLDVSEGRFTARLGPMSTEGTNGITRPTPGNRHP